MRPFLLVPIVLFAMFALRPAFARDDLIIVGPSCGPYNLALCTDPAERARAEARKNQLDAKAAADAQAREAARLQKEADIGNLMKAAGLGPGREDEARRLFEMRQAAYGGSPPAVSPPLQTAASDGQPDKKLCPKSTSFEEVLAVNGLRQPSRELAMASLSANPGVYDAQCSSNDFGWQCSGKRKSGKLRWTCSGGAAQ